MQTAENFAHYHMLRTLKDARAPGGKKIRDICTVFSDSNAASRHDASGQGEIPPILCASDADRRSAEFRASISHYARENGWASCARDAYGVTGVERAAARFVRPNVIANLRSRGRFGHDAKDAGVPLCDSISWRRRLNCMR